MTSRICPRGGSLELRRPRGREFIARGAAEICLIANSLICIYFPGRRLGVRDRLPHAAASEQTLQPGIERRETAGVESDQAEGVQHATHGEVGDREPARDVFLVPQ